MSDALSFDEIHGQQVELLPARTVMSMFATCGCEGDDEGGVNILSDFLNIDIL
ncbi:MAG: hypothetical protein ACRDQU_23105 [Pseudonocardiaceae bacterium]